MQLCEAAFSRSFMPVYPRRLMDRPGGHGPSDARSIRAGDTVTVADMVMQRIVDPPYAGSNPVSHLDDSRSGTQVPLLSLILDQWFYWSFVQWQGSCLIHSRCGFDSRSSDHASLA